MNPAEVQNVPGRIRRRSDLKFGDHCPGRRPSSDAAQSTMHKVLFVDDEQKVLDGLRLALRKKYCASFALGPEQGLRLVRDEGPFAVVVSDLKMPLMDGIEFLSKVREIHPKTVRIILTGFGDMESAINAVNIGQVFRFHTKPCSAQILCEALDDGMLRYAENVVHSAESGLSRIENLIRMLNANALNAASRMRSMEITSGFTPREMNIACLICAGAATKEIAQAMNISGRTVETYRNNIRSKLGIASKKVNLRGYLASLLDQD